MYRRLGSGLPPAALRAAEVSLNSSRFHPRITPWRHHFDESPALTIELQARASMIAAAPRNHHDATYRRMRGTGRILRCGMQFPPGGVKSVIASFFRLRALNHGAYCQAGIFLFR